MIIRAFLGIGSPAHCVMRRKPRDELHQLPNPNIGIRNCRHKVPTPRMRVSSFETISNDKNPNDQNPCFLTRSLGSLLPVLII
jgi:hypothetical protein